MPVSSSYQRVGHEQDGFRAQGPIDGVGYPAPHLTPPSSYGGQQYAPTAPSNAPGFHTSFSGDGFNRKSARQSMERIVKSMKPREGDDTAFVGVSTGNTTQLSSHNDAVAFVDELSKKMQVEDGGIWAFPPDQLCTDGYTRPVVDSLTPLRVECLSKLIPLGLATRSSIVPGNMVNTYLVTGGRLQVPFEMVTITDWTRILVAEMAATPVARQSACEALYSITLQKNEAWASASARLVLNFRAANVDYYKPHTSEQHLHWRFISDDSLIQLMDRTRRLLLPVESDFMSLESHMVSTVRFIKDRLSSMPVDTNNPMSRAMVARGEAVKQVHTQFVSDLTNRGSTFYSQEELSRRQPHAARGPRMGAVSHKRSLDPHDSGLASNKRRPTFSRSELLGAVRDVLSQADQTEEPMSQDSSESEVVELSTFDAFAALLAAFTNRPASIPGKNGTPFVKRNGVRAQQSRSLPMNNRSTTEVPHKGKSKSMLDVEANQEEEEELPEPTDSKGVIFRALKRLKVCFFHAKGISCPHQSSERGCRYSHDDRRVKYGYYSPPTIYALSPQAGAEEDMSRAYGVSPEDARSESTNGTSTTRLDTPERDE